MFFPNVPSRCLTRSSVCFWVFLKITVLETSNIMGNLDGGVEFFFNFCNNFFPKNLRANASGLKISARCILNFFVDCFWNFLWELTYQPMTDVRWLQEKLPYVEERCLSWGLYKFCHSLNIFIVLLFLVVLASLL